MGYIIRLLFSVAAISSPFFMYFMYRLYIIDIKYNKYLKSVSEKLINNLTNQGVVDFMSDINSIKRIPNTRHLWDEVKATYNTVNVSQNIDMDIKTQLRVMLRLKGVNNI